MYKIFAAIASIFAVLSITSYILFHVKDNKEYSKEVNDAVKDLVAQTIEIQYKVHDEACLENIFTEELQKYVKDFYRDKSLYFVNGNYMETLQYSREKKEWSVTVRIHEGLFESVWLEVIIIKKEDGSYVISDMGRDI